MAIKFPSPSVPTTSNERQPSKVWINISFPMEMEDGSVVHIPLPLGIPIDELEVTSKTYAGSISGDDRQNMLSAMQYLLQHIKDRAKTMEPGSTLDLGDVSAVLQVRGEVKEIKPSSFKGVFAF